MKKKKIFWFIIILVLLALGFYYLPSLKSKFPNQMNSLGNTNSETALFDKENYNFTFNYPKDFLVTETISEEGTNKILVESSKKKNQGFEISILPFDEPGPLTEARIKQDLPDMLMENVKETQISQNIQAISFNGFDESTGKTFEVWFIYNGNLYQFLSYSDFAEQMKKTLETLKFK